MWRTTRGRDAFTQLFADLTAAMEPPYKLPQTADLTIGCGMDLINKDLWYVELEGERPPYASIRIASGRTAPNVLNFSVRCGAKDYPTDYCVRLCTRCMKTNGLLW